MTIREMIYQNQRKTLSPRAFFDENSSGRDYPISDCDDRGEFQRDRDRILHSKAFRRLMHKTQVFLSPEADHYRTRLTHTLEVTQIARTIARSLSLNEDLAEAAALGHDLGHTPFGHAGERMLQRVYDPEFTHYKQSIRVVEKLENLNLTREVRDGILNHTNGVAATLEGQIIRVADLIAYVNHDIDDATRAGILSPGAIPETLSKTLGYTQGERIQTMIQSVVRASGTSETIVMEPDISAATERLKDFLFTNVYFNPKAKGEEHKAEEMLESLFRYFEERPEQMPEEYVLIASFEGAGRAVCDYISGMTDRFAIQTFKRLFVPEVWSKR